MKREDFIASVVGVVLLVTVCVDFTAHQARMRQDELLREAQAQAQARQAQEQAELAAADVARREEAAAAIYPYYLERWENPEDWMGSSSPSDDIPVSLFPLLKIDEDHELCYRRLWTQGEHHIYAIPTSKEEADARNDGNFTVKYTDVYANRVDCVLKNNKIGKVSQLLSGEGLPFARDLGESEYGLILDGTMIVFDREDYTPLRLEPAPEQQLSDMLLPGYLTEWRDAAELSDKVKLLGDFSGRYGVYMEEQGRGWACGCGSAILLAPAMVYLEDREQSLYTPLLYTAAGDWLPSRAGILGDGRFALCDKSLGTFTFDAASFKALNRYDTMRDVLEGNWNPVSGMPYKQGKAELGAVRRNPAHTAKDGGDDALVYGVAVYGNPDSAPRVYSTDIPFDEFDYFQNRTPQYRIYGDRLVFYISGGRNYESTCAAVISLTDGSYETACFGYDHDMFFNEGCAVSLEYRNVSDPLEQDGYITTLEARVWTDGRSTEPYIVEATDALVMPRYLWDMHFTDADVDLASNILTLKAPGWVHTVDLNALTVTSVGYYPETPDIIYGVSEDGRYMVGSLILAGEGDMFTEQLYLLNRESGKTMSLRTVQGMYGDWGVLNITGGHVSMTNSGSVAISDGGGTRFYELSTGKEQPVRLPSPPYDHYAQGVVYDESTGWYLRASSNYRWDNPDEQSVISFDCYATSGDLLNTWTTDVRQQYDKFGISRPIHLTSYNGKALFLEYQDGTETVSAIACFDPHTGSVTRTNGNYLLVSDGYLFTVSYVSAEDGGEIDGYVLRQYREDALLAEQVIEAAGVRVGYMEYDKETGRLTAWSSAYKLSQPEKLFETAFGD